MASTPSTPAKTTEADAVVKMMGTDPWLRFDMWATRSWESMERAVDVAFANAANPDEALDHRILALFHASAVAKEFAEMVNPLMAVSAVGSDDSAAMAAVGEMIVAISSDDDD